MDIIVGEQSFSRDDRHHYRSEQFASLGGDAFQPFVEVGYRSSSASASDEVGELDRRMIVSLGFAGTKIN